MGELVGYTPDQAQEPQSQLDIMRARLKGPRDLGEISAEINRENLLPLVGAQLAVLLQAAHPLVAQGIDDHSRYQTSIVDRFLSTRKTSNSIGFGTPAQRQRSLKHLNGMHDGMTGVLRENVGAHVAGTEYSAMNPELLKWVWATLVYSGATSFDRFVRPLTDEEKERYYQEARPNLALFGGNPEETPDSYEGLTQYMGDMIESGQVAVGSVAKEKVLPKVFVKDHPVFKFIGVPFSWMTIDMLPPAIRDQYGLSNNALQTKAVDAMAAYSRTALKVFPAELRFNSYYNKAVKAQNELLQQNQNIPQ